MEMIFIIDNTIKRNGQSFIQGHTEDQSVFGILYSVLDGDRHWNVVRVASKIIESALKGEIQLRDALEKHRFGDIWIGAFRDKEGEKVRLEHSISDNTTLPKEGLYIHDEKIQSW